MIQAPIINSFYRVASIFSLKLLVDSLINIEVSYFDLICPISIYVGSILIMEIAWRLSHLAWMKSQPFVRAEIIAKSYDYVQNHSYTFFQENFSGSIISKIKGILTGYNNLWFSIHHRLTVPLMEILVIIIAIFFINFWLFIFLVLWSAIFFPLMLKMSLKVSKLAKETTDAQHSSIAMISDNISNIFSLFAFATRKKEFKKISQFLYQDVAAKDYAWIRYEQIMALIGISLYLIMLISALFFMIFLRKANLISVGDFLFVMTLLFFVVDNIWKLVAEVGDFLGKIGDLKSSFSILAVPQEKIDHQNVADLEISKGEVIFKNLSFSYSGSGLIDDLNLTIKAGEKIGLVGFSGAGKSTLISLLMKNFAANSGDILIDDQSIYDFTSDSLRCQIALIPQDTMLFHRTIAENIGYARENANQEEIIEAAKKAHIHDFISSLPQGYETYVGERGIKLSGGQRQRISIARAILKKSPILILDEATSSLDSESEKQIQESLNLLISESAKTVIAIAHRLATLKNMDRIIVLDKGKIIEEGTHQDLISKENSLYKKLWELQKI